MMINANSQPHSFAIHGTLKGANTAPTFAPELKIPVAKDRSFLGKYSAGTLIAAGKFPASPNARNALAKMNPSTDAGTAARPNQPNVVNMNSPIGFAYA